MKRFLVAGFGFLALAAAMPASAADLPRGQRRTGRRLMWRSTTGPASTWASTAAARWGDSDWNGVAVSNRPSGGMIGGTAGYNWQGAGSPWVFGLEGDVDWTNIKDSSACGAFNCQTRNNWFGTARGRVGYAFDRFCRTSPAALAFGDVEANRTGFAGLELHQCGLGHRRRHRRRNRRQLDSQARISLCRLRRHDVQRRGLRHGDQRRPQPQRGTSRRELPLLIKTTHSKLEAPHLPVRGFNFFRRP